MADLSRRSFIRRSLAATGATFFVTGTGTFNRILGANDAINIGVAGIHGRGGSHIGAFTGMEGVRVTCLIDPDARTFKGRIDQVTKAGGAAPKTFQDIRKALDDKSLDVISIATTNHWHSPITIWACQAGKDVYVEKPLSHNVHEGRVAVQAARKFDRIVQHGTQGRSDKYVQVVQEHARRGTFGKLLISRGLCYKGRGSIGFKEVKEPPAELDFDIWNGPAPKTPYHENLVHYNWHWFWDFGNGDIGNQGVHEMDKMRWAIPDATLPKAVLSMGGRFGYKDQGETANTQIAIFDFGDTIGMFEVRGLRTDKYYGQGVGNVFHFEKGIVAGGKFFPKGSDTSERMPDIAVRRGPGGGHFANFIAAVRTRRITDLNADVLDGHYSSACCHLPNISYRLGEDVPFDKGKRAIAECKDSTEMLERMIDHLESNGVKIADTKLRVGRKLTLDPGEETFIGDGAAQANPLLTRNYRAPYTIPEKIV
ncbi:MAG: Gfo/Idh/MocA family oxidoreductase [Planctomycetes bacterium]|nr:Gfo/Idh/MocA family oxidoreductase [Planctomycetota bacterium]